MILYKLGTVSDCTTKKQPKENRRAAAISASVHPNAMVSRGPMLQASDFFVFGPPHSGSGNFDSAHRQNDL
jgi:hypothetical protein